MLAAPKQADIAGKSQRDMPTPTPARHRRSILFMTAAAMCWSTGGILVRQLSITNAWEIVFWRSLFMALFVAGTLLVLHGPRVAAQVAAVGWPGVFSGVFLGGTFFFFIASVTRTTVANTFRRRASRRFWLQSPGGWFCAKPFPCERGLPWA